MTTPAPPVVDTLGGYTKAVVSILAAIIAAVAAAITDNTVTALELAVILIAAITTVNVYLVPNLPEGRIRRHAKSLVAFFGAALALLVTTLGTGGWSDVTASEWLLVILAGLGGIGVTVLPNTAGQAVKVDDLRRAAALARGAGVQ